MTENTRISGHFFLKRLIMFLFVGLFFFLGKSLIAFGADEYCPVSPAPPPVWSDGVPAPPNNNLDLSQYFYIPSVGTSSEATNTGRPDWYNRSVAVLTTDRPEQFGVMWGKPQIDLTQDFEIHAYVYLNSFSTPELPADGIAFVLHNDPDGTYAYGRQGWGLGAYGHRGSNLTRPAKKINNALVFEMDTFYNGEKPEIGVNKFNNGQNGGNNYGGHTAVMETNRDTTEPEDKSRYGKMYHQAVYHGGLDGPKLARNEWQEFSMKWSAQHQTAVYRLEGYPDTVYRVRNLEYTFGGTKAYFGFTASTGGSYSHQRVSIDKIPGARVTVYYKDIDTGEELAPSEELWGYLQEPWESEQKQIDGYTFVKVEGPEQCGYGPTNGIFMPDEQSVTYYYQKPKNYKVNVKKLSSVESQPLSGAQFRLEGAGLSVVLRDKGDGTYEFPNNEVLKFNTTYTLTEIKAPAGHTVPKEKTWAIRIDGKGNVQVNGMPYEVDGDTIALEIVNEFKPVPVAIRKYTMLDDNQQHNLAGAVFQLQREQNGYGYQLVKDASTGADGIAAFAINLPGNYRIKEVTAPIGYGLTSGDYEFMVDLTGKIHYRGNNIDQKQSVWTLLHMNELKPFNLTLAKVDESGKPLKGAKFQLTGPEYDITLPAGNEQIDKFSFNDLPPGDYQLREIKAPEGYDGLTKPVDIKITKEGKVTVDGKAQQDVLVVGNAANQIAMTIKNNQHREPFQFYKVNEAGNPMKDVEFTLYECLNKDNDHIHSLFYGNPIEGCWQLKEVVNSGSDGLVSFKNLDAGNYLLSETNTNSGYELPTGYWTIQFDPSQKHLDERVQITAHGDKLPPAFFKERQDDMEVYKLPNYPVTILPMTGTNEHLIVMILGVVIIGSGIIFSITVKETSPAERATKNKEK